MKKAGILNRRLAMTIAAMGHTDLLVVGDAGLPVPTGVPCVDLAVTAGLPALLDVVQAIATELQVEGVMLAEETRERRDSLADDLLALFPGAEVMWVSHQALKKTSELARAVVRTGETTPYANIILRSGVTF
ncbi:MAG: D-ribose pyranase [Chloroflexota bacterium]|nr:D-ribose pyranase [Chloroflexota bacterium]